VLPRELLPARWSGLTAARLFADRHQRWSGDAKQERKRLNDRADRAEGLCRARRKCYKEMSDSEVIVE